MSVTRGVLLALALSAASGRGASAQDTARTAGSDTLPPVGFGTLKQEDIALQMELPGLILRVIPLAEPVIRLLSPDTYASLHRLAEIRAPQIDSVARQRGIGHPTVFLVSFFAVLDRVPFRPDEVTFASRNQLFHPAAMLPMTPAWNTGLLSLRTTASAVYVLDQIPVLEPIVISYGGVSNGVWENTLRTLDQERAQVVARAAARHN